MNALKPDTLNGQKIFRPVTQEGGVNHVNHSVFFPPSLKVGKAPLEALVEQEARAIVGLKALTSNEIAGRLFRFAKRVIANEDLCRNG